MLPGEYKYLSIIAKTWNEVYLAENVISKHKCCIKQVLIDAFLREKFQLEIQILQKIKANPHPNIIAFEDSFYYEKITTQDKSITFGCIVMELGITNLFQYIKSKKQSDPDFRFQEQDVANFYLTMIKAHQHLQEMKIAHRDIKPENIILVNDENLNFKVCDVGFGTEIIDEESRSRTIGGTIGYQSPEIYTAFKRRKPQAKYNPYKSDVFSLGLVFLLFGTTQSMNKQQREELFDDERKLSHYLKEQRKKIKETYPRIKGIAKILKLMLEITPEERYDFIQLNEIIHERQYLEVKQPAKINHKQLKSITQFDDFQLDIKNKEDVQLDLNGMQNKSQEEQLKFLEAITQQVKNFQMITLQIKLEMSHLNVRTVAPLEKLLSRALNLKELSLQLWNNKLGNLGLLMLSKQIMKMVDLKKLTLEVSNNMLSDQGINNSLTLLEGLKQMEELRLDFGLNHLPMECSEIFFTVICGMPKLKKLDLNLESNYMNQVLSKMVNQSLKKLPNLNHLTINFSNNPMHNEGLYELGESISELEYCELILWGCQIKDMGMEEFAKGLQKCEKLKQLNLTLWNNQITKKGCEALGHALLKLPKLNILIIDLSKNKIEDDGVRFLAKSIHEMQQQIRELKLWIENVFCSSYGLRYVNRLLTTQKKLRSINLNLRSNQIELNGMELLYNCFGEAVQLEEIKLILDHNPLTDQGVDTLFKGLQNLRKLQKLIISLENVQATGGPISVMLQSIKLWPELKDMHVNFLKNQTDYADEMNLKNRLLEVQSQAKVNIELKAVEYEYRTNNSIFEGQMLEYEKEKIEINKCSIKRIQKKEDQQQWFQKYLSFYQSRTGPKNQVVFDGEKKNSIRTYNDNQNNRQGFKIGWDIDQTRKEDLKIAGKVGQDQRNSANAYQGNAYQAEQKQDDDYLKQMYYQEMNRKQEQVGVQYKQGEHYYQDSLDQYNGKANGNYSNNNNQENNYHDYEHQQPSLLQQSNKYDHYQQPNDDEALYQKYKQGNNGNKQYSAKPPIQQYNPITGIAYGNQNSQNAYNGDTYNNYQGVTANQKTNPYEQQQQDDALSQFSQMQQHKVTSMKNRNSNIFNADLQETENINNTRQNSRVLNRKKELDDAQYKGYGQFYKNPIEQAPTQYKEQQFVNRNKIDNHIFPK
ncbi:unnamed protein product [Paramecium sonneborni]|uniref:Protein kinase domain-containing protein n=1 Tax=Paramecium sonneborni TaxID=65129 RepID=A0A8S1RJQ1_9CILI|nr:unnamed protein product [Paramecium sonneborni]